MTDETAQVQASDTQAQAAAPAAVESPRAERSRASIWTGAIPLLLLVALIGGAYFRFTGLDWDHEQHLHPDERFLTMVADAWKLPGSLGQYFDNSKSSVNP